MRKEAFICCLGILFACEEPSDLLRLESASPVLVVEAILTNENKNHLIELSHPHRLQNSDPLPATGATVAVIVDNVTYQSLEWPAGSGKYYTEAFTAVFGKLYTLYISYQGKQYYAVDGSVPVEPLPPLQYEKTSEPFFYRLTGGNGGSEPSFITYDFDWNNTTFCTTDCAGRLVRYDLKTIEAQEIFKPDQADFVFPVDASLVRRKYSISPRFKTYLRGMLSETEWRGGYFDVDKANAATNLSEGATGFFAVTTVVTDTTKIVAIP